MTGNYSSGAYFIEMTLKIVPQNVDAAIVICAYYSHKKAAYFMRLKQKTTSKINTWLS